MAHSSLKFNVHHIVPLDALKLVLDYCEKAGAEMVSCTPQRPNGTHVSDQYTQRSASFEHSMHSGVRTLILEKLRAEKGPLSRRDLVKLLTEKGFAGNSTGPTCAAMKAEGLIVNPKRGYWALPR